MRKIKLEEICPYLPYGLRCQIPKHRIRYGQQEVLFLNGISLTLEKELNPEFLLLNDDLLFGREVKWWRPVVRPLSDLTKEIEHNRDIFVPIAKLSQLTKLNTNIFDLDYDPINKNFTLYNKPCCHHQIDDNNFFRMQKLFEWHFDVFNWLKDGLAVNINEL